MSLLNSSPVSLALWHLITAVAPHPSFLECRSQKAAVQPLHSVWQGDLGRRSEGPEDEGTGVRRLSRSRQRHNGHAKS